MVAILRENEKIQVGGIPQIQNRLAISEVSVGKKR